MGGKLVFDFSDSKPQHHAYQEHDFAGKHVFDYLLIINMPFFTDVAL